MKRISMITLACLLAFGAAAATTTSAQTRRRTTSTRRARAGATATPDAEASASRTAAARVAEQIKSLGKFLYLYGPISKELAASEAGASNSSSGGDQSSPAATETMQRNRAKLREVFQGYRQQMDELETLFSNSTELRKYYTRLLGVAASAAQAENSVASGRYDEGGRALLDVMNRLTDVLLEMQGS